MFKDRIFEDNIINYKFVCSKLLHMTNEFEIVKNKKTSYYNMPISFDIEASSFESEEGKVGIMYLWTACVNGYCFYGRTWEEALFFFEKLKQILGCNNKLRLIIYVHNLSYEFQFMRELFKWDEYLFIDSRRPVFALSDGLEFRCSYLLSRLSLEKVGENLSKYKIKKMSGDLDYSKIRHSRTPLTTKELNYAEKDVRVVCAYIKEEIEKTKNGKINQIPYTSTGRVRAYLRNNTIYSQDKKTCKEYRGIIKSLTLNGAEEYEMLKQGFSGGFVHSNAKNTNKTIEDVASFDFSSAYPACMCLEQFPMSKGEKVEIESLEDFNRYLELYCCLFEVTFYNIKNECGCCNYISKSKCFELEDEVDDNGRIASASSLSIVCTDIDFDIIKKCYKFDEFAIGNMYVYKRGYLPKVLIKSILDLYRLKTELKGVENKKPEYMVAKSLINSVYGCVVTDINKNTIIYDKGNFIERVNNIEENIKAYNENKGRFLFYPWGVWITAYCRRNLWSGILECGDDFVYSDTDSIKMCNYKTHYEYVNKYNNIIKDKVKYVSYILDLPEELFSPKSNNGEYFTIGLWDYEGASEKFKTIGAKRYLTKIGDEYNMTVSGIDKVKTIKYMKTQEMDLFEQFNEDLYIPKGECGRTIHTYVDIEKTGKVKDYLGVYGDYYEKTSLHIEESDFSLSVEDSYLEFISLVLSGLPF